MCRPDVPQPLKTTTTTSTKQSSKELRVLLSLESFDSNGSGETPAISSCVLTGVLFIGFLVAVELFCYHVLTTFQGAHDILTLQVNRQILARHVGVDAVSCLICAVTGWLTRHVFQDLMDTAVYQRSNSMPRAAYEQRLFTYHPGAYRVALFFLFYQIKNLYDTIIWHDGPEFIFHHVFSIFTAWGCISRGVGLYYAIFFFGISEISTCILCVLANFDDDHGVPGLGDAFPMTKVALGGAFVVFFILCRCIFWPIFSYYFCRDILMGLDKNDARSSTMRNWMKFFLVSLSGLSVLQVAWLGQIFIIAKAELTKVGLL